MSLSTKFWRAQFAAFAVSVASALFVYFVLPAQNGADGRSSPDKTVSTRSSDTFANPVGLLLSLFILTQVIAALIIYIRIEAYTKIEIEEKNTANRLEVEKKNFILFGRRTEKHHSFIHKARDVAVKSMGKCPMFSSDHSLGDRPLLGDLHKRHEADIKDLLDRMATMFQLLVPDGSKVWVCIRHKTHADDYRTCIRQGDRNADRESTSKPLPSGSRIVTKLWDKVNSNRECVVLTGRHDPDWYPMLNDDIGETESVLIGAILLKSYHSDTDEFRDKQMVWLLCLCSDHKDAFNEGHKNLMKCCNDAISWLVNGWARSESGMIREEK